MDLDLTLDLLCLLLLFPELGLLLKQSLLEAGLDGFIGRAGLGLAVGAFLEVSVELLFGLEQAALLDHERVTLVKILEQRVIVNKLILFIDFLIGDQPVIANIDLIVAFRGLALTLVQ